MAGFSVPKLVYWSENATTSTPSENILTPNGVPHTWTLRASTSTARTVLMGIVPNSASVTLRLVSCRALSAAATFSPFSCAVTQGIDAICNAPPVVYKVSGSAAASPHHTPPASRARQSVSANRRRKIR